MLYFDTAFDTNIVTKGKDRVIVVMMLDRPDELFALDTVETVALRQFLRQFKYVDYRKQDWRDKLFYALPLRPMDQPDRDDDVQLLQTL